MHCHRFLFLHFLLTCHPYLPVLFQRNIFTFTYFLLGFVHCLIFFLNVALVVAVVAVAVIDTAVGSVKLQRERKRLTVSCVELQRGSLPNAEKSNS